MGDLDCDTVGFYDVSIVTTNKIDPVPAVPGSMSAAAWGIAEILRHDLKPSEFQNVVLPFVFLARTNKFVAGTSESLIAI